MRLQRVALVGSAIAALWGATARADFSVTTYGAVGDGKVFNDGTTVINTKVLSSAASTFVSGDVGKIIWCVSQTGGTNPLIARTTITSQDSAHQVHVNVNANDTVNANAKCIYATQDDTPAFVAAVAAAQAGTTSVATLNTGNPGKVTAPPGNFIITSRILNYQTGLPPVSFVGSGRGVTILYPSPDITIPSDGTAVLMQVTGNNWRLTDFTIEGLWETYPFNAGLGQDLIRIIGCNRASVERVSILDMGPTTNTTTSTLFSVRESFQMSILDVTVQEPATTAGMLACKFDDVGQTVVQGLLCSNQYQNLQVLNSLGRSPTSATLTFVGGIIDECESVVPCTQVSNSEVNFVGTTFYGEQSAVPGGSISVDGTSKLWISDANVGPFNQLSDFAALNVAAGGIVYSSNTTWRSSGNAKAIYNAGTFVGSTTGNDYRACAANTCTSKSAPQLFSGNLPVTGAGTVSAEREPVPTPEQRSRAMIVGLVAVALASLAVVLAARGRK